METGSKKFKNNSGDSGARGKALQEEYMATIDIDHKRTVEKCAVGSCFKFYHESCLKENQNVDYYINNKCQSKFRCPVHYCSGCGISGNSVQILQCVKCPISYHLKCFRADRLAVKLTKKYILCGQHSYI